MVGVSNFSAGELQAVCASSDEAPAVNQVQLSPFHHRRGLLDACRRLSVAPAAWGPLTHGEDLGHPTVADVARVAGRTQAQVLLRWGLQRDLIVIPKSTHLERIRENAQIFDFELSGEQMSALDALDRTGGTDRAQERPSFLGRLLRR
jgi:2,5-diketo-D-gluconate reductase A